MAKEKLGKRRKEEVSKDEGIRRLELGLLGANAALSTYGIATGERRKYLEGTENEFEADELITVAVEIDKGWAWLRGGIHRDGEIGPHARVIEVIGSEKKPDNQNVGEVKFTYRGKIDGEDTYQAELVADGRYIKKPSKRLKAEKIVQSIRSRLKKTIK